MHDEERSLREEIIAKSLEMGTTGLNQGTSGNISARYEDRLLITPSATPYDSLEPEMIASISIDENSGSWSGPLKPSTEWRFHLELMRKRPEIRVVIHAHSLYCTSLAMTRKEIPACHYMVAAFGGNNVRCSPYATYGGEALSKLAIEAMEDRTACLLANHGMIVVGENLSQAMWRAIELETIAHQYFISLQIGGPEILTDPDLDAVHAKFASYGQ